MEGKDFGYYDARMGSAIHRTTGLGMVRKDILVCILDSFSRPQVEPQAGIYEHSDGTAHPLHYESDVPINF